ncbi:arginine--tRNA ligase [Vallitalea guaymasensis]|uniref:Arginine--tRNA ligase n=1 Tax=Vallitalea guaymasensis TaxID=1185412 RepID=A0A8J8SCE7_9FIRM|nr:arginine--tRNA ligase [Vallitalea guaymasensis]QUH29351.1 arginine--tRNA ligase [Vallitalea guaymasensis]
MEFKKVIVELLSNIISDFPENEIDELIEIPSNSEMGDFAFPCFKLAKIFRKAPNMIAADIGEKIGSSDYFSDIKIVGAYVNFYVNKKKYVESVLGNRDAINGKLDCGEGKTIVLDYSSPNIAKPFHIGHLRTTIIGNALYNIHEHLGYKCVGINHLGDWGTQFGKLIVAYKLWGSKEKIEKDGINELTNIYVKFHEEAEKNPQLDDDARAWFTKMENGDEEALALWQWFKDISLKEFNRIYDMLDIKFDSYAGESFYNDKMDVVIEELDDKGLIKISEGAKIVELEDDNMPPCLITKKDGSTLYATRDITAAIYRKKTYDFEKCIYVTAFDQNLHFAQWFKVIDKMGYDWHDKLIHVPYGLVSMESGKLSTRKGKVIYLEELLNESIEKTKQIIEEKNPNLKDKEEVAKIVGIGAILFNDMYNNRIKDVVFSWDKVLNFEGETGPYVQYTYARASSVLRKAEYDSKGESINYDLLTDDLAFNVVKTLQRFQGVVVDAAEKLEPSFISRYVVDLAQEFNRFYHNCPIIVDDMELRNARLEIVSIVRDVIREALRLLGIKAPEQM